MLCKLACLDDPETVNADELYPDHGHMKPEEALADPKFVFGENRCIAGYFSADPQPVGKSGIGHRTFCRAAPGCAEAGPGKKKDASEPSGQAPAPGGEEAAELLER